MIKTKNVLVCVVLAAAMLAGVASCGRPKTIPESELSEIFSEMYLVNAYSNEYGQRLRFDSINIYEPILNSHGYTTNDFTHTLANFTKRRSARIDDVIAAANKKLTVMLTDVESRIARSDKIDSLSLAFTREEVYRADSIHVTRIKDTSKLHIMLPAREGSYRITHWTLQDSTDKNSNLITKYYIRDTAGTVWAQNQNKITLGVAQENEITLDAGPEADSLEIKFADYREKMTKPNFRIDSLEVSWCPPIEKARRLYAMQWLYEGVLADTVKYEWYNKNSENDSDSLRLLGPYVPDAPYHFAVRRRNASRNSAVERARLDSTRRVLQRPSRPGSR